MKKFLKSLSLVIMMLFFALSINSCLLAEDNEGDFTDDQTTLGNQEKIQPSTEEQNNPDDLDWNALFGDDEEDNQTQPKAQNNPLAGQEEEIE